jgi:hypothetical protein
MPVISTRQLKSGMVLAAPAANFLGDVLLKSGAVLSVKNIVTLKSWGVKSVAVLGDAGEVTLPSADGCSSAGLITDDLDRMFATVKDQPVMRMIYEIVRKQALSPQSTHD